MSRPHESEIVLVLGGARSGKSRWALEYAENNHDSCVFLATAEVLDEEMAERVRLHKQSRGSKWGLVEEPLEIAQVLEKNCRDAEVVLIDCLTVWLSNALLKYGEEKIPNLCLELLSTLSRRSSAVVLVANEVGSGIVPENALGRTFRDLAGTLNQDVAAMADRVILTVAGIATRLKGGPF